MANLVTKAEYKAYRGLKNPDNDVQIDALVLAVSDQIKGYCGATFVDYVSSDKTEYFTVEETGHSIIILSEFPLISITSLWERTSQDASYIELFTAGASSKYDYIFNTSVDTVTRTSATGTVAFPVGYESVKILYKAGYSTLPYDLQLAVFDLITYYLKEEYKVTRNINGTSLELPQGKGTNFPSHIRRALDYYRVLF